jgi:hypothetical protein
MTHFLRRSGLALILASFAAASACSGGASTVSGTSTSPDASSSPASNDGNPVHGKINGRDFVPTSAYANVGTDGEVALIFTSEADACSLATNKKVSAGATYVQLYGGEQGHIGDSVGSYTAHDAKVAVIDPACGGDAGITASFATRATDVGAKIEITRAGATTLAGTVSVQWQDGSTFEGSFSVPICAAVLDEDSVCN